MLIQINNICNQKCFFCSFSNNEKQKKNLKDWLEELGKDKENLIQISGGEPLLADTEELLKFLYFIYKKNKIIEFQTNGTLIVDYDEEKFKKIVSFIKASKGYFNVNFSSHSRVLDYKITKTKNAFKKRLKGLEIIKGYNAKVRLTYIINSLNYKYLPEFAKFALKNKKLFTWIQFSFVKAIGKAKKSKEIVPKYSKVKPYLIKALNLLNDKVPFYIDHIPLCFLGDYWNKNVDVNKNKLKVEGVYQKEKIKTKFCEKCKLEKFCSGARIDYLEIYPPKKNGEIV